MKKITAFVFILLCLCGPVYAKGQNFAAKPVNLSIAAPQAGLTIGEELEYRLEWLGIPVGRIVLKVEGIEKISNRECYHISANATPNKFFAQFYDLAYVVNSYVDKQDFYSRRFQKTRRLKGKVNKVSIDFDREKQEAEFNTEGAPDSVVISPVRSSMQEKIIQTRDILPGVQDLLSSFYYFRLQKIKENETYGLNIYYDRRNWQVEARVDKPVIKDIRKSGSWVFFKVTISSDLNSFILGKNQITVYFGADSRRIPLEFNFGTGLGAIHGKLTTQIQWKSSS